MRNQEIWKIRILFHVSLFEKHNNYYSNQFRNNSLLYSDTFKLVTVCKYYIDDISFYYYNLEEQTRSNLSQFGNTLQYSKHRYTRIGNSVFLTRKSLLLCHTSVCETDVQVQAFFNLQIINRVNLISNWTIAYGN